MLGFLRRSVAGSWWVALCSSLTRPWLQLASALFRTHDVSWPSSPENSARIFALVCLFAGLGLTGRLAEYARGAENLPANAASSDAGTPDLSGLVSGRLPEYNRDIRPILSENCFACHGPDSASRKADLRLDKRDVAVEMGAIVPGKPAESELLARITSTDPELVMPPATSHKTISAEQIALLRKWIEGGAEYQPHWSFIAPVRPTLPSLMEPSWVRNPVDAFVLAKLEAAGLKPAPEADRRTLARRLSLDLTGLPPTPEMIEEFLSDSSPDYYEKFVDRLMSQPEWGEHRGRYWLDAARYADTHGIHFDNYREIWSYRDWVVKAFNQNMPFDQFTVEQLAGDLLPNATLEQRIASGFNRCNITTNEGGAIDEEYLVLYTRDRTETTSQVWLGLTTGCAVCHDHKFDPISQKEFYQMAAFFNNTTQAAMDGNVPNTPPIVHVARPEDAARYAALPAEIIQTEQRLKERRDTAGEAFNAWVANAATELQPKIPEPDHFFAPLTESEGTSIRARRGEETLQAEIKEPAHVPGAIAEQALVVNNPDITFDAGGFAHGTPFSIATWFRLERVNQNGALLARMDTSEKGFRGWDVWLEDGRMGTHIVSGWNQEAIKAIGDDQIQAGVWNHVALCYDGTGDSKGVTVYVNGRKQTLRVYEDRAQGEIKADVPLRLGRRHEGEMLQELALQDVRLFNRVLNEEEAFNLGKLSRLSYLANQDASKWNPAEREQLFEWWITHHDNQFTELHTQIASLKDEVKAIEARGTVAHVMNERSEPAMAYILARGEYDKRKEAVQPATPAILPALPTGAAGNRLTLSRWLLTAEHPLTTRVTVNRFWQELFGTGLVRTSGDFGVSGELPSHPELLDYMAVEFRESGWDVKRFFKLLVTSATYRQSSQIAPASLEKDPANRLLSRGPRFRMDAEMVRDYALASSGSLVRRLGGPSVRPYQPSGVWEAVAMIGSDTRDYKQDHGDALYRRSLYTFWKRAAPPASLEIFNAPAREVCTVRRERTNTPLQALVTLNDPQYVEAARRLAARVLHNSQGDDDLAFKQLGELLVGRPWTTDELQVIQASLADLRAHYVAQPAAAKELLTVGEWKQDLSLEPANHAAWTMLSNQLLNLDEVLCK